MLSLKKQILNPAVLTHCAPNPVSYLPPGALVTFFDKALVLLDLGKEAYFTWGNSSLRFINQVFNENPGY